MAGRCWEGSDSGWAGGGAVAPRGGGWELSVGIGSSVDRARSVLAHRGGSSPLAPCPVPRPLTLLPPLPGPWLPPVLPAANSLGSPLPG